VTGVQTCALPISAAARPPLVGTAAPSGATGSAEELARAARSLEELREALMAFEDCALKRTATNLVFGDGNPHAPLMIVGEAPGADEDRLGVPFVGVSGRLLDRMMAAIGLDRTGFYITNVLPWRPPGNRNPSAEDLALCLPFIRRHVALVRPKVLLMVGGASAKALLDRSEGIMRLRGRWLAYRAPELEAPIPALATYHPAYLLRQPGQKRDAWRDLVQLKLRLIELGLVPGS
jgi:DNA polymerase